MMTSPSHTGQVNATPLTDKTNTDHQMQHLGEIKKAASSSATTVVTTSQFSPTPSSGHSQSKIPYPLSMLSAGQSKLLQRSSSLRLRGPKSNLHIPRFEIMEHISKRTTETSGRLCNGTGQCDTTGVTHAGFSFRRKVHSSRLLPNPSERKNNHYLIPGEVVASVGDVKTEVDNSEKDTHKNHNIMESNGDCQTGVADTSTVPDGPKEDHELTNKKREPNKMTLNLNGPTTNPNKSASPSRNITPCGRSPKTPPVLGRTPLSTVPETKLTPKTPPVTPDSPSTYLDDDLDSLYSFATTTSGRSTMSCEHPYVARNGTTFSGRKMKYVVHCSNYAGQVGDDYLTPTQRAQRQIRRLKELLCVARNDLEQKDTEILRLTREVVELRLFKASLSSPEDRSNSSDAVTVREADLKTSQDVSPIIDMVDEATGLKSSPRHIPHNQPGVHHHHHICSSEMQSSFADSGHFEDLTSSSVHSKDSSFAHTQDTACGNDEPHEYEDQRQELIKLYEQRIEELIKSQDSSTSDLKRSHNDRVEALLQKLAECNTRYADMVPDYEQAKERIRELEKQLEDLQRRLTEQDDKQSKMYLHMYTKGQEEERIARADQALELAHRAPNKVSITELLHQLQSTQDELENIRAAECRTECGSNHALLTAKEAISLWVLGARKTIYRRLLEAQKNKTHVDPEVTLQFLKSAVYYFLTDKENSQGHLKAIESILEFTEAEKQNISKARISK